MPTYFFPLTILTQHFEDETHLAEALNFHEISRFNSNAENAVFSARVNAEQSLKDAYTNFLHTKIVSGEVELNEVIVKIIPPHKSSAWREPIELKFHVLQINREDEYLQAYVPALGIAVLSKKSKDFDELIKKEIISTLRREGFAKSLKNLRWLQRVEDVTITKEELAVTLPTTKQKAIAEEKENEDEKSVLEEVGDDLNKISLNPAYQVSDKVEALAEFFKGKKRKSLLLVGASGVGKTAIFHQFVLQAYFLGLKDTQFWATSGARLIAGQGGFGMWQERCTKLVAEAKKIDLVLHLGNLIELLEVGKSTHSTQGIASFLRPKIARGELCVVTECTPEQLPILERRDPNLLSAFQQIRVEELSKKDCLQVLRMVAKEFPSNKTDDEAIKKIDATYRRYSAYTALPAKPVRFLRNLFHELEFDQPLTPSLVYKSFSNETGLPEMLLNDEIALDLIKTEQFFQQRVIGQDEAIKLVIDLIATIKAKLTRPKKPIASLLFIGPTGVGKTEMVKSLAEFFFSDKSRMVRFDMSEFSNPLSVQRLIGGTGENEGLLTAKVREQPFSVVLLDEFEKAHHSFFDLLLQILGEGRLTDSVGRTADFTNSIIVMTSNLGASEFQRGKSGFMNNARERQASVKHFTSAVREFLRPEIFNRLDRIVPFAPLDEKTVVQIAELEIEKIKKRDGLRFRKVKLDFTKDVISHLASNGYDVRYGARPLKRTFERELLAPLSTELNLHNPEEKLGVEVSLKNGKISLEFTAEETPKKQKQLSGVLAAQAEIVANLRRKTQKFSASYKLTELNDEIYQVIRLEALIKRNKWLSEEDLERVKRKPKIQNFLGSVKEFSENVNQLEDDILLEIYGKTSFENRNFSLELSEKESVLQEHLFKLLSFQYPNPNEVKLAIFSENASQMFYLMKYYRDCFQQFNGEIKRIISFTSSKQADTKSDLKKLFEREIWRREITDFDKFINNPSKEILGFLVQIEGELVLPRFGSEEGIHRFVHSGKTDRILVHQIESDFEKYDISDELAKRDSIKQQSERRIYDHNEAKVKDLLLNKTFSIETTVMSDVLTIAMQENLVKIAEDLI
ncbi:MAG TPA: AAA family ATPase [Pyrinomonadaceae bacterium]|nr:AAA family ATPase [Pyrinomonadaceae bacterium]